MSTPSSPTSAAEPSKVQELLNKSAGDVKTLMKDLNIDTTNREDHLLFGEDFLLRRTDEELDRRIINAEQYLDFDARRIIAQFFKKAEENIADTTIPPALICGGARLYEKNDPRTDLLFFINVFLERGHNIAKIAVSCDPAVGKILRRKAQAYGIITNPKQNETIIGAKELTLSRLALAFSFLTAAVIISQEVKGKLVSKLFGTLPVLMQHTIFPGFIPVEPTYTDELRNIALILHMEMSICLASPKEKRKMSSKTIKELIEASTQYVDAAINGVHLPDSLKIKVLIKAGIVVIDGSKTRLGDVARLMSCRAREVLNLSNFHYSSLVEALPQITHPN